MEPMEQESDRIERHIEQTREKLGRNLNELETRVRTTFDWRGRYEKNPWAVLGLAFGAGAAIAASSSRRRMPNYRSDNIQVEFTPHTSSPSRFSQTWSRMQDALLAAATRQAETFLSEVVPGFEAEYRKTETPNRRSALTDVPPSSPATTSTISSETTRRSSEDVLR